uniref:Uncharacterized protein n=1 Tax=Eutreptiella gymnastica TaxID=73025 RepID=A0A7S4FEL4_9EUGL|mmetsp:Transcript_53266/g.87534  ORF Transcript_53266/g.87534 Transcript_53266/m.87534 type:complete len:108 (+) Transcript_53266:747-1070(+)
MPCATPCALSPSVSFLLSEDEGQALRRTCDRCSHSLPVDVRPPRKLRKSKADIRDFRQRFHGQPASALLLPCACIADAVQPLLLQSSGQVFISGGSSILVIVQRHTE